MKNDGKRVPHELCKCHSFINSWDSIDNISDKIRLVFLILNLDSRLRNFSQMLFNCLWVNLWIDFHGE